MEIDGVVLSPKLHIDVHTNITQSVLHHFEVISLSPWHRCAGKYLTHFKVGVFYSALVKDEHAEINTISAKK